MKFTFKKSQKHLAAILLFALLSQISFFPFFKLEKAHAQTTETIKAKPPAIAAVTVIADCISILPPNISDKCWKDMLQALLLVALKAVLRQLTDDIVRWINTGFQGSPLFVTDFEDFLFRSGDEAAGLVLDELIRQDRLPDICSPFRIEVIFNLFSVTRAPPKCTISKVIANVNQMYENFQTGGWASLIAISTQTNNNAFGTFLVKLDDLTARVVAKEKAKRDEAKSGKGFMPFKKCVLYKIGVINPEEDDPNDWIYERRESFGCEKYENRTPGSVIADAAGVGATSAWRELEVADSVNRILAALLGQALQRTRALLAGNRGGGLSGYSPRPAPDFGPLLNESRGILTSFANAIINPERSYLGILRQTASTTEMIIATIEELAGCDLQNHSAEINNQRARLQSALAAIRTSEIRIALIENLKERIGAENDPTEFGNIRSQIMAERDNIRSDEDIATAQAQLTDLQNELVQIRGQLEACRATAGGLTP